LAMPPGAHRSDWTRQLAGERGASSRVVFLRANVEATHGQELVPRIAIVPDCRLVDGQESQGLKVIDKHWERIAFEEHQETILGLAEAPPLELIFLVELQDHPCSDGELADEIEVDQDEQRPQTRRPRRKRRGYTQEQVNDSIGSTRGGDHQRAARSFAPGAPPESHRAVEECDSNQRLPKTDPHKHAVAGLEQ